MISSRRSAGAVGRQIIETHTGLLFNYADPQPDQICVEDIAHALAHICRFGGHIHHHHSVASHAMLVRQLVLEAGHPELGYPALHHDSHEAYVGDIPTPLKTAMGIEADSFRVLTDRVDRAVAEHLGINPDDFEHPIIKEADQTALRMEAAALKVNDGRTFAEACGVEPLEPAPGVGAYFPPDEVKGHFLIAHQAEIGDLDQEAV